MKFTYYSFSSLCLSCSEPFDWPSGVLYSYSFGLLFTSYIQYIYLYICPVAATVITWSTCSLAHLLTCSVAQLLTCSVSQLAHWLAVGSQRGTLSVCNSTERCCTCTVCMHIKYSYNMHVCICMFIVYPAAASCMQCNDILHNRHVTLGFKFNFIPPPTVGSRDFFKN